MTWTYTKDQMPSDGDTLYWVAYKSLTEEGETRIGDAYLTAKQIRKGYRSFLRFHWEIYAYAPVEPITPPPLP